jgi:SSS family transporter
MYRAKPLDAMRAKGWIDIADMPSEWSQVTVFPTGQSHVMMLGGTASDKQIATYHVVSDMFAIAGSWSGALTAPKAVCWGHNRVAVIGLDGTIDSLDSPQALSAILVKFAPASQGLRFLDYVVILLYLAFMMGVGVYFSNKEKTTKDFFLGGRKIPWWAVGISLYATGTSAISFMAIPTKAWTTSTLYGVEGLVGLLGMVGAAYLVIPIIRRLDITSTYQYLERRFNVWLRLWGSALNIAFQMGGRMSVVLLLPSMAISAVTGLPVMPVIATLGLLATIYTVMGGISAVIWTDVAQVVVLFGGAIVAFLVMIFGSTGGVAGWVATNMDYEKFRVAEFALDFTQPVIWIFLFGALIGIGGGASDQVMVQRVLSTPSVKQARKSYLTLALIVLPGTILFTFLGTALFGYFRAHPEMLNPTMSDIDVLPLFIVNGLPAGISGLVIAGLFAASMSTLDSSMNSVSTMIVEDFYKRFKRNATDRQCLKLGKWLTAFVGIFGTGAALLMASFEIKSMFDVWTQICALILGGFAGVFMLGMFTKRANGWGALIGAVSSIGITLAVKTYTSLHFMAYGSLAILSCIIIGYIASLLIPHPPIDLTGLTVYTPGQDETEVTEEIAD